VWCRAFISKGGVPMLLELLQALMNYSESNPSNGDITVACWALLFKLLVYLVSKHAVGLPLETAETVRDVVFGCVTEVAAGNGASFDKQKSVWGPAWRSVNASAISWGLALLRELLHASDDLAVTESLLDVACAETIATSVLCAPESQDRVAVGAGTVRLIKRLLKSGRSKKFLEHIIAALLKLLQSSSMFAAWTGVEQYFRMLKACMDVGECSPGLVEPFAAALLIHPVLELSDTDEDPVLQGLLCCFPVRAMCVTEAPIFPGDACCSEVLVWFSLQRSQRGRSLY
jgi:hypothetical protein